MDDTAGRQVHDPTGITRIAGRTLAMPALPPGRCERVLAGFVATIGCLAFCIAANVDPYDAAGQPRSHGTHRQLGLPPCTMLAMIGFPCPACGMTTAVSLIMHGDLAAAWRVNWAGAMVAIGGLPATVWLWFLACGKRRPAAYSMENVVLGFTIAAAIAASIRYVGVMAAALASTG